MDPNDQVGRWEHMNKLSNGLQVPQLGVNINTWIWDPSLWVISLYYFNDRLHTHTWDPGLWLYIFTPSADDNTFLRGVECWDPP